MRVAMVGPFGFAPKKTMRARAFRLAKELVACGHTVCMFMPPWHTPEQANHVWTEAGVKIVYVAVSGGPHRITQRLIRAVAGFQTDVVHCFKPKAYSGFVADWLWRTQRRKVRIVMDMDDWEGWGGWNELEAYPTVFKHIFAYQEQAGMKHCHALTVASRALETLALGNGVAPKRIHYVPNGPGIEVLSRSAGQQASAPTVLLYSRFFEFDVARLVSVLKQVRSDIADLTLRVVGASLQAEDGRRFEQLMRAEGLWEMVDNVGWVDEAKLPEVLTSADVGIYLMDDTLLNRTKCPVKLADMCALGIPVVGEAVGQVTEYIDHNKSGVLCPSGDVDAIATALTNLLQHPTKCNRFGNASRKHMQQFMWSERVAELEAAYAVIPNSSFT